ncbi:MAG: C39 family peptidase [Pseudomonadales bacterium]
MPTLRLADPDTAARYPLPVSGSNEWHSDADCWTTTHALPPLAAGTLLVPSLAPAPDADGAAPRHRWTLIADGGRFPLPPVPSEPPEGGKQAPGKTNGPVSCHIDCFRVHRSLSGPALMLSVEGRRPPERYLLTISARPFTIATPPMPTRQAATPPPPPRSQMNAPPEIAARICSPTCVSMVLAGWQRPHDWLSLTGECLDPGTGMYGVWPLALRAAARRGSIGAVEVFSGWEDALTVLERGIPLVTSIRFGEGELPGAPLGETGGHLVVVFAAGPDGVDVCDPAAADAEVRRRYPAAAFSGAWLRHRGAAYILPP